MRASQYNEREKAIFDYINDTIRNEGYSPTVRDIQSALGIKSTSTVHSYLTRLEEKGLIVALPKKGAFVTYVSENQSQNKKNEEIMRAKESISRLLELGMTHDEINGLVKEVLENDQH